MLEDRDRVAALAVCESQQGVNVTEQMHASDPGGCRPFKRGGSMQATWGVPGGPPSSGRSGAGANMGRA